jgi:hypothetical protein
MSERLPNPKSDVPAKRAFIEHLMLVRGFDEARVTGKPADVTARKDGQTFYFEIKFTAQRDKYFGAATLTEWEAALTHEENYRFVIATMIGSGWDFREYTPLEFMRFSYIPPFKIFFNIPVNDFSSTASKLSSKRVHLTKERMSEMVSVYGRFRSIPD